MCREFNAQTGRTDILGLPAKIFSTESVEDFDRAILLNPQAAPAFGSIALVARHLKAIMHQQCHPCSLKKTFSIDHPDQTMPALKSVIGAKGRGL
jgi:hypothetical protein